MKTLTLLVAMLGLATPFAIAADASSQACRADAQKVCAGTKPGGGRLLACLQQHEAELSSGCKAALPTLQQCAKELQSACGDSARRGLRECLRENAHQISPECRRARNP
jgi:hypothetical protein